MKKFIYRITINEPLVLVEKEKTEQSTKALEYIPGNVFRGLIASAIFKDKENRTDNETIDDMLFNGKVRFSDAHLVIDSKRSYKVPLVYYYDKSKKDENIYKYPYIDYGKIKPKQIKMGYFVEGKNNEINIQKVLTGDSIKSARSKEHRSSKEGNMYVYRYLKKGQEFEFEVIRVSDKKNGNDNYLEEIKRYLTTGEKFIGKAKGSEYGGKVSIENIKEEVVNQGTTKGNIIYAESNLCFLNEYGEFTARPTGEQLTGNPNAEIDWEKSQLRFRTFMPYNYHRQNWDAERLIIEKGSVFVLKNNVDIDNSQKGCFVTEGYGRILVNPGFLKEKFYNKKLKEKPDTPKPDDEKNYSETNDTFLNKLIAKKENQDLLIEIQKEIDKFVGENKFSKSTTSSQWSRAYNIGKRANDTDDLIRFLDEELFKGKSKEIWKENDQKIIKKFINDFQNKRPVYAFKLLCKRMRELNKNDKN